MNIDSGRGSEGGTRGRCAFSVVVPAFNEEQALQVTLDSLHAALEGGGRSYEIVVVDDGSTDATAQILGARRDVTVVRHATNRGYGAALKTGIRAARYPLVVVMDADGTYPVAAVPQLVDGCENADMAVGARIGANVHASPARSVAKWCFRQFAQWITGATIPDLNSGLRVFRRAIAERFMELLPDGFSFTTTITVSSILEQCVVRFHPVDYMPRIGRSKVHPVRDTLRIGRQLLRLGLRFAPLRTSVALALPLFIASVVWGGYSLAEDGRLAAWTVAWVTAAVVAIALGIVAEQRVRRRRGLAVAGFAPSREA